MILYLDTSALVKLYVLEKGSAEVSRFVDSADAVGTSLLAFPEMASAVTRAAHRGWLKPDDAQHAWDNFVEDWESLVRLNIANQVIHQAGSLARTHGLRAYDAVHLSVAVIWQDALQMPVTLSTFDHELWRACSQAGFQRWPEALP